MQPKSTDVTMVSFSVRAYRLLLAAYPAEFRQEYGPHMLQLFRDCSLRSYKQDGTQGMLLLWAVTVFDIARSVIEQHMQRETSMNKQRFVRLSGWALILGPLFFSLAVVAVSFLDSRYYWTYPELRGFFEVIEYGFGVGPFLIGVGMLGLLARYGDGVGLLGKLCLLVGAIGAVGAYPLAFLLDTIFEDGSIWPLTFVSGLALMLLGLALYGVLAVRGHAMPRWNGLSIIAGLPLLVFMFIEIQSTRSQSGTGVGAIFIIWLLVFAVALVLLGYMLQADRGGEPAVA